MNRSHVALLALGWLLGTTGLSLAGGKAADRPRGWDVKGGRAPRTTVSRKGRPTEGRR
jgi:hypothetical protein